MSSTQAISCQRKDATARGWLLVRAFLVAAVVVASPLYATSARVVDDMDTVSIPGNVSPRLLGSVEVGRTDGSLPVEKMILVLRPRAGTTAPLERLLEEQLDPASPNFHRWLTPEEYGRQFGIPDEDLNAVLAWLQRNGFAIENVAPGRGWVNFSGTVADVERTFRTEMRDFVAGGQLHRANVLDPALPRALSDVVGGVVSLHDFFKPSRPWTAPGAPRSEPAVNLSDGSKALGPADFAIIYGSAPLLAAGVDGTGQTIAVVSRTNIKLADTQQFRSFFGLPARDPVITVNGTDPGIVTADEGEADLDVQWAGAVAPGATVDLVVSSDTATSDGVDLSAQYIVDHNLAPILTMSYGLCESDLGSSGRQFYNAMWQQAAAQGITVLVAAGDSGAADCDDPSATPGTGRAVNGLSSTPYNVCVGGTQFADASSSQFWNASNAPGTHSSAKSYIPEQAWNESASVNGGSGLWATGGGPSAYFARPSWQSAPGVPGGAFRDTPDVSLNAASNVGYIVFQGYDSKTGSFYVFSGTSASAPSLAGIMALVGQRQGVRLGNPNPVLYRLATAQYGGWGPAVFHDVTSGDNGVPGVSGFPAGAGYDLATGLGSVDAQALVNSFGTTSSADLAVALGPPSVSLTAGDSANAGITTTASGAFNAAVSLSVSGLPVGVTGTFSPQSMPAPGSGVATLALSSSASTVPGTYSATVTASGGGLTRTAPLSVAVFAPVPPGSGYSVTRLVPIVLNVAGLGSARYSTELTLANRGSQVAKVQLSYTAATALSATGSGSVGTVLGPGRQLVIPDAVAYLRVQGLPIPADGSNQGGTLLVTFSGLSSNDAAFASARTTTPSGTGRAGLSYPAARIDDVDIESGVQTGTSWLYGLRENGQDRTNLALLNASTSSPITLAVTLFDGSGAGSTRLSPDVTLGPGQWTQASRVLSQAAFASGYARVDVVSGSGPYFAYAVINDNVTNDGSFVPPRTSSAPAEALFLPVLVETSVFQSELVLANSSAVPQTATLTYVESLSPAGGSGGSVVLTLAAGEQRTIPSAIDSLRQLGVSIGSKGAASYAGSLAVRFLAGGAPSSGFAGARTAAAAAGGGEYGVFNPGFGLSETATAEAWVFGLQQTSNTRSNLAVADVGEVGSGLTFHLEVYDGDTGQLAGRSADTPLGPHAWVQVDDVLSGYAVSNGLVRVVRTAGADSFLAYGVVNDGATPTSGATNDGSFLAFCNR